MGSQSAKESLVEDLKDPEFRKEWERTALARAVAIEVTRYRTEHGISQTEFGKRLGMHDPAISRLEEGVQTPSIDRLRRLSEKLGIDLNITIHSGELEVERLAQASAYMEMKL